MISQQTTVWVVDVFHAPPLLGNPAAVIVADGGFGSAAEMQKTAAALMLPTTAFLVPLEGAWRIRWFTPKEELNLCGHATLAAAAVLGEVACRDSYNFQTEQAGVLVCRTTSKGSMSLDLPSAELSSQAVDPRAAQALAVPVRDAAAAPDDFLYELADRAAVASAAPDMAQLAALPWRGHVITARAAPGEADFVSRSFFPALGVDEDQVCVSAHCKLAPYWAERLGRSEFEALQLSQRGGRLRVRVEGPRVHVEGSVRIRRRTDACEELELAGAGLYRA